jgi:hypothetical protein
MASDPLAGEPAQLEPLELTSGGVAATDIRLSVARDE